MAEVVGAAARRCRMDEAGVVALRRAALVHDLGRVAVNARIWQKPGPLTADELEQVRLHPYHSERVLARSAFLAALSAVAGAHHEDLTDPAITAPPPARSCRLPRACWRPPTRTTR